MKLFFVFFSTLNHLTIFIVILLESGKDPNTVILRAFNKEVPKLSEEVYNFIMQKIREFKNTTKKADIGLSAADEIAKYKKLLDDDVISSEEFEKKKQQLLGL